MTRRLAGASALVAVLLGALPRASATGNETTVEGRRDEGDRVRPPHFIDLRIGSTASLQSVVCGQLSYGVVSVEGCGTGANLWNDDPVDEVSHYRLQVALAAFRTPIGWVSPRVGAGFAEMQIGLDSPGFAFTSVDALGTATAGPEASAGLQSLYRLGAGFELVIDLSLSAGWFPHAPELKQPRDVWQLGGMLSTGIGF